MYISLKMTGLFACIMLLTTSANAEYYLVYPDSMATCASGCRAVTCHSTCCSGIAMVLHYRDTWRSHNSGKLNRYRIEQISDASCVTSSCCTMRPVRRSSHEGEIVRMRYDSGPARAHYVNTAIDPYYPDMATGDDEIMTDSDMNNQY